MQYRLLGFPHMLGLKATNQKTCFKAKEALKHPTVDTALSPDKTDIYDAIDTYITQKWQDRWVTACTAKHNKQIQPIVNNKVKYADSNRRKDVSLTRLGCGWVSSN